MRILEEFWYGNIEPTEYDTSSYKEYKKLLELICRNEEKLEATMTDERKDLFEKYADCVQEYQTITDVQTYFMRVGFVRHGIGTPEVPNCSTTPLVLLAGAVRSRTRL